MLYLLRVLQGGGSSSKKHDLPPPSAVQSTNTFVTERLPLRQRFVAILLTIPTFIVSFLFFPITIAMNACAEVCLPAYASALGSMWNAMGYNDVNANAVFLILLGISLALQYYSYSKSKRVLGLPIVYCLGAFLVLVGKIIFESKLISIPGHVLLVCSSLYNIYPSIMGYYTCQLTKPKDPLVNRFYSLIYRGTQLFSKLSLFYTRQKRDHFKMGKIV